jgi:hypothetical protein
MTYPKKNNNLTLLYGGQTNSMFIRFEKYENISLDEFTINTNGSFDIPLDGIFARANADKIFFSKNFNSYATTLNL